MKLPRLIASLNRMYRAHAQHRSKMGPIKQSSEAVRLECTVHWPVLERKFIAYKCRNILRAFHCRVLGGLIWKEDKSSRRWSRARGTTRRCHVLTALYHYCIRRHNTLSREPVPWRQISHMHTQVSCLVCYQHSTLGSWGFFSSSSVSRRDLCCCRGERKWNIHFLRLFFHTIFFSLSYMWGRRRDFTDQ